MENFGRLVYLLDENFARRAPDSKLLAEAIDRLETLTAITILCTLRSTLVSLSSCHPLTS